ncbi:MAG: hypothetical protein GVY08_08385 [Bacteroidetes bacterium]|jgi:hypothetical protein|nr:hypothetical protein [Bacteroidota bacterium]
MLKRINFLSLLYLLFLPVLLHAQDESIEILNVREVPPSDQICQLPPTDINAHFYVKPSPELLNRMKNRASSSFEVDFNSSCNGEVWPQEARDAFEYATMIWSEHIRSTVPIKIDANWVTLTENTLGSARPARIVQVSGAGSPNTWYTLAQLSALTDRVIRDELDGVEYDIEMNIRCNFDDWYFGTDANTPEGMTDFVTVVIHEIGHGIGFLGSMDANNDTRIAEWGLPEDDRQPLIYDRFAVDGDRFNLIDERVYLNPSSNLYEALVGNRGGVFFDGTDANATLQDFEADRAKLFTPEPYRAGSSYSHFDQETFRRSINALMVPFIDRAFAIHTPGPLFCGTLSDMGWPLGAGCLSFIASDALIATDIRALDFGITNIGQPDELALTISNQEGAVEALSGSLELESDQFSITGETTFNIDPGESREIRIEYDPITDAPHEATLSIFHNAKNEASPLLVSLEGEALKEGNIVKLEQSYPNPVVPNSARPTIPYVISEEADVRLDLYTIDGRLVRNLVNQRQMPDRYPVELNLGDIAGGIYIYRIIVDDVVESGKLMIFN